MQLQARPRRPPPHPPAELPAPAAATSAASLMARIKRARSPEALQQLLDGSAARLDHLHASALLVRLAHVAVLQQRQQTPRLNAASQQLLDRLAALFSSHLGRYQARQLASCMWALGKLKLSCTPAASALAAAAAQRLLQGGLLAAHPGGAQALDVSHTAWGLARLQRSQQPPLADPGEAAAAWQLVGAAAQQHLPAMNAQQLSNTLWAFGQARAAHPQLMEGAAARICSRSRPLRLRAQHVANLAWAFARLGRHAAADAALWQALQRWVVDQAPHMKAQGISVTLWAFARAGASAPAATEALVAAARPQLKRFRPQALSGTLWSLHTQVGG